MLRLGTSSQLVGVILEDEHDHETAIVFQCSIDLDHTVIHLDE